jgi:hypothetical protein
VAGFMSLNGKPANFLSFNILHLIPFFIQSNMPTGIIIQANTYKTVLPKLIKLKNECHGEFFSSTNELL